MRLNNTAPGKMPLAEALREMEDGPAAILIGPEGGFVPCEVQLAEAAGAQRVHLGERILSVDTALPTVLAQALPTKKPLP